jgi:hypothetical protein
MGLAFLHPLMETHVAPAINNSTVFAFVMKDNNAMKNVVPKKVATIRDIRLCMLSTAITGTIIVSPRKHAIIDLPMPFAHPSGKMKIRRSLDTFRRTF